MELVALPGFEPEASNSSDSEAIGLSGRWSTVSAEPVDVKALVKGGKWYILAIGVIVALGLLISSWPTPSQQAHVQHTLSPQAVADLAALEAPGSLGLKLGALTDKWNEVNSPPRIAGGFIRTPDTGRYDTFRYRFSETSLIAGAYDRNTEYLYGLMATSWLTDESATRLAAHLCHVVQPYSQECLDAYFETGLQNQEIQAFTDLFHEAEWISGDHRWRVTIDKNVQTIRVAGSAAG